MKTAAPVTTEDALADAAFRYARGSIRRVWLAPGEEAEALTLALPWGPVLAAAAGLCVFGVSVACLKGEQSGLAIACLGLLVASVGSIRLFKKSFAIRSFERRTLSGMRLSDDNTDQTTKRH